MDGVHMNRLEYLDLLRGVAVLGLLLMNITDMGMFSMGYVAPSPTPASDYAVSALRVALFDGRFRSLFCLLFGIGLYLQYMSFTKQQLSALSAIKSRLRWLLAIGLVHGVFIWPGDILLTYALCGFLLLSKIQWSGDQLLKRGVVFFTVGMLSSLAFAIFSNYTQTVPDRNADEYLAAYEALSSGYFDWVIENLVFVIAFLVIFPLLLFFYVSGLMYIGLGLFKLGLLTKGFSSNQVKVLFAVTLIIISFDLLLLFLRPQWSYHSSGLLACISGLTMALLIWHWVLRTRLYQRATLLVLTLKRAGRMALTLYLMQSMMGVLLFKVLFPHWNLEFTLISYTALAFILSALQLVIAHYYLAIFERGPVEYLWRRLVNAQRFHQLSDNTEEVLSNKEC